MTLKSKEFGRLESIAAILLKNTTELVDLTKQACASTDDNDKLFMASLCARKAQIELDSCLRYLCEAGKPAPKSKGKRK